MSTQPLALRLANRLENFELFPDDVKTADELRRLYAVNQELLGALKRIAGLTIAIATGETT